MHKGKRIIAADLVVGRVGPDEHEIDYFQQLRDEEGELRYNYDTPALPESNTISIHETSHPYNKRDHREFPCVYNRYRKHLQGADQFENGSGRTILKELKRSSFVFDKGFLDIKQEERNDAK